MRDFRHKVTKKADEVAIAETTAIICMYLSWEKEYMPKEDWIPEEFLGYFITTVLRKHNYEFTQIHVDAVKILLKDPIDPSDIKRMIQNEEFDGYEFRKRINLSPTKK
tara:strand:- start:1963 stop:2286 length:324 start_codon:yes stop_codon:yes gene_type:complete